MHVSFKHSCFRVLLDKLSTKKRKDTHYNYKAVEEWKNFSAAESIFLEYTTLALPTFNLPFDLHNDDTSDRQLEKSTKNNV